MQEEQIREAALNAHWHASRLGRGDANAEHDIYD
jgi:hypothetical protein